MSRGRRAPLVALTGIVLATTTACGNWVETPTDAGQVGVTVDAAGRPVVAVVLCEPGRAEVQLAEGRHRGQPDSEPNRIRGGWVSRRAFRGVQSLTLTAPGRSWQQSRGAGLLEPDQLFLASASVRENPDATAGQVAFRPRAVAAHLHPGRVQAGGHIQTMSEFAAYRCHGGS